MCLRACYPIPRERHRCLVTHFFSIFDGYVVDATTTFGALRGASGERIPFSAGPLFIDIFVVASVTTISTREAPAASHGAVRDLWVWI